MRAEQNVRALVFGAAILGSAFAAASVKAQTISLPIPGKITVGADLFDTPPPGYMVEEHFMSGRAKSFAKDADGAVKKANAAPYKTRLILVRPSDPAKFNGTVLVEWLNVSAGTDAAPDWNALHREIVRSGYAYVGVSAQKAGLDGGALVMENGLPIKKADPVRYGALSHPGDPFAYDIFSQAGRAVRKQSRKLLGPLKLKRVLGIGESQSAMFLTTYVNDVDPLAKAYDGFLIHSRFLSAPGLDGDVKIMRVKTAPAVKLRKDLRVPALMFIAEGDLMDKVKGYLGARQDDGPNIRTWEIPGAAHADTYTMLGSIDTGAASLQDLAKAFTPVPNVFGMPVDHLINAAPQHHYAVQAALAALNIWVSEGKAPKSGPRIGVADGAPPAIIFDAQGNAAGGVRTPWMDAPTFKFIGVGPDGPLALFGETQILDAARLEVLYPGGKADYLQKFEAALDSAIKDGFILAADRREILDLAAFMYRK